MESVSSVISATRIGNTEFQWGERTYVMGICNLSPDSFSGDGLGSDIEGALAQAQRMVEEGADIIDVGGESTRPGKEPLPVNDIDEELRLVIPVIERLAGAITVPISVDTYKHGVARRALEAGASMINDIWALRQDPRLAQLAAERNVPIIMMSNQRDGPVNDIMTVITADLKRATKQATEAGVPPHNIILDPGIGFGKSHEQNLEIVRRLAELKTLGQPILLGSSRKSLIGLVLDLPTDQRLEGTAATLAIGIANGADIVRVHDVEQMVRICRMSDAIIRRRTSHD
ncbi:MAG TPA: dihydropteroate synthase [Dehalococcoidales bacterium]|nr:dihydropteroate synthase [Dehalococcoidales bacterium]